MGYNSTYEVRLAWLEAIGGDVTKTYNSVFDISLAILDIYLGGVTPTEVVVDLPAIVDEGTMTVEVVAQSAWDEDTQTINIIDLEIEI